MKKLILAVFLLSVVSAQAQTTVINPTKVEFTPSADHNVLIDGQAVVAKYEIRYFVQGSSTSIAVVNLGKPTPVSNLISTALDITVVPLSSTVKYVTSVAAMGPTGEGVSSLSNPFMRVGPPAIPGNPIVNK
jgi:hypothetical protein